jgi:hypothetical protein
VIGDFGTHPREVSPLAGVRPSRQTTLAVVLPPT